MVNKAQDYIESNLHEKIPVERLSSKFSVGRRTFDRRFVKAPGNTPGEYSERVKVESAKKAFETSRKTINEVMYEVGYLYLKAFREVFRKIPGMSPMAYRRKYNKEAAVHERLEEEGLQMIIFNVRCFSNCLSRKYCLAKQHSSSPGPEKPPPGLHVYSQSNGYVNF